MRRVVLVGAMAGVLATAPRAGAQAPEPAKAAAPEVRGAARPAPPAIDTSSLRRIRQQLSETPPASPSPAFSLLKLNYYVQVVGKAPRYELLAGFNVGRASAVQYGAMTNDEFLRMAAPFWRRLSW